MHATEKSHLRYRDTTAINSDPLSFTSAIHQLLNAITKTLGLSAQTAGHALALINAIAQTNSYGSSGAGNFEKILNLFEELIQILVPDFSKGELLRSYLPEIASGLAEYGTEATLLFFLVLCASCLFLPTHTSYGKEIDKTLDKDSNYLKKMKETSLLNKMESMGSYLKTALQTTSFFFLLQPVTERLFSLFLEQNYALCASLLFSLPITAYVGKSAFECIKSFFKTTTPNNPHQKSKLSENQIHLYSLAYSITSSSLYLEGLIPLIAGLLSSSLAVAAEASIDTSILIGLFSYGATTYASYFEKVKKATAETEETFGDFTYKEAFLQSLFAQGNIFSALFKGASQGSAAFNSLAKLSFVDTNVSVLLALTVALSGFVTYGSFGQNNMVARDPNSLLNSILSDKGEPPENLPPPPPAQRTESWCSWLGRGCGLFGNAKANPHSSPEATC